MTVTYADHSFISLLRLYRGSIYKAVWKSLVIYLIVYYALNLSYRFAMNDFQQATFENLVQHFGFWGLRIPLTFLLGFYVSFIMTRWWQQFNQIAWPDRFLVMLTAYIRGNDEETVALRRQFARYCTLQAVLVWRNISLKIKKRFPTDKHLIKAGLITTEEYDMYRCTTTAYGKWFAPTLWMINILNDLHSRDILSDRGHSKLVEEIFNYRAMFGTLLVYDWISVPLVYTQVVTIATYGYFVISIIGQQTLIERFTGENFNGNHQPLSPSTERSPGYRFDSYVPVISILEFIFYVGWLKVAEFHRQPFGEHDDDFDMNYILDRMFVVGFKIVDEFATQMPRITRDPYRGQKIPKLPHTVASDKINEQMPRSNLATYCMKPEDMEILDDKECVYDEAQENPTALDLPPTYNRPMKKPFWNRLSRNSHIPYIDDDYMEYAMINNGRANRKHSSNNNNKPVNL